MTYVPDRGHALWLSLNPTLGHEQGGKRPVIVLSPGFYNQITSRVKGYPFEVAIPEGLPVSDVILADQIRSLDWNARTVERICALPDDLVQAALARSRALLS